MDHTPLDELEDSLGLVEAARAAHVSRATMHRWVHSGRVRAYKVGPRHVRIPRAAIAALCEPVVPKTDDDGGSAA